MCLWALQLRWLRHTCSGGTFLVYVVHTTRSGGGYAGEERVFDPSFLINAITAVLLQALPFSIVAKVSTRKHKRLVAAGVPALFGLELAFWATMLAIFDPVTMEPYDVGDVLVAGAHLVVICGSLHWLFAGRANKGYSNLFDGDAHCGM